MNKGLQEKNSKEFWESARIIKEQFDKIRKIGNDNIAYSDFCEVQNTYGFSDIAMRVIIGL